MNTRCHAISQEMVDAMHINKILYTPACRTRLDLYITICVFYHHADNEMDGESLVTLIGSKPGPDIV